MRNIPHSNPVPTEPEAVRETITRLFLGEEVRSDSEIDSLLSLHPATTEARLYASGLDDTYLHERFLYEGTPYITIWHIFRTLALSPTDILYDLGSGYGRLVLTGSIVTRATFHGIEIVPERVQEAVETKLRLGLDRANFHMGNVLDYDWSDGTVFFLFNPFTKDTLEAVGGSLEIIAQARPIRVVTLAECADHFATYPWLSETSRSGTAPWQLAYFTSRT